MIDVVIDSNIYRSEGLNKSQNLALLKDMGNNNFVKIHIPWFVYKECVTQNIEKRSEPLNKVIEAINQVPVDYGKNEIEEMQNKLTCLKNNVIDIEEKNGGILSKYQMLSYMIMTKRYLRKSLKTILKGILLFLP